MRKAKRAAARRGRRLRIMFTDEARFGRMNRIRPCWAPIGMRPEVAAQLIREYIYLYGAVSPKDGTCVYLIMPTSNTACFQVFLDVLARRRHPLHGAQSQADPLHHLFPLYRQLTLMQNWY